MYIIINKNEEQWKKLKAYNIKSKYDISNYGNIRTRKNHKPVKYSISSDGYKRVNLRTNDNTKRVFLVHRLVAFVFVEGYNPSIGKVIVNHLDSIREHTYYENLEWVTIAENVRHGYDHGHIFKYNTPKPINVKFSDELLHSICGYLECGYNAAEIYKLLDIDEFSQKSISDLINRLKTTGVKIYERITQYYNIPKVNPIVPLNPELVETICDLLSKGYYTEDIIRMINIPPTQVNKYRKNITDIKYHKTFCDISIKYVFPDSIYCRKSLFCDESIIEICEQLQNNIPLRDITRYITNKYNYEHTRTRDFIYDIKRRRIHTDISYNYTW